MSLDSQTDLDLSVEHAGSRDTRGATPRTRAVRRAPLARGPNKNSHQFAFHLFLPLTRPEHKVNFQHTFAYRDPLN